MFYIIIILGDNMSKDKVLDFAKRLNEKYTDNLNIPILGGFKPVVNPGTMFTAVSDEGYVEQFIVDSKLLNGEDFESHLNKVIDNTTLAMQNAGLENADANFKLHKKYSANGLDFVVYIQDNIMNANGKRRLIRQFNIYFVEPKSGGFHLLSLASPPFNLPSDKIIADKIDLVNDKITNCLDKACKDIMDHITYK